VRRPLKAGRAVAAGASGERTPPAGTAPAGGSVQLSPWPSPRPSTVASGWPTRCCSPSPWPWPWTTAWRPRGRYDGGHHWASGRRELVVVDRTGDPGWHQATRQAVPTWSEAAAGTDMRLPWEAGRGPCRPGGLAIAVCLGLQRALGDADHDDRQGVARVLLSRGHTKSAVIQVCRDCGLDAARRAGGGRPRGRPRPGPGPQRPGTLGDARPWAAPIGPTPATLRSCGPGTTTATAAAAGSWASASAPCASR